MFFGGLVLLLSILVFFLLVFSWIHNWERASSKLSTSIPLGGALPLAVVPDGLGDGVGDCHDAANLQREGLLFRKLCSFLRVCLFLFLCTAEYACN